MKMRIQLILVALIFLSGCASLNNDSRLIAISRNNCVKVEAYFPNNASNEVYAGAGTGFFLDPTHIVTCFHVVMHVQPDVNGNPKAWFAKKIKVVLVNGEEIPAVLVSVPSKQDKSPVENDFAIFKLSKLPAISSLGLPLYSWKTVPNVGSDIVFSGYPFTFDLPTMITHKGYISGLRNDERRICIQAPVNQGNSGGALLNYKGEVLGIINAREGFIPPGLQKATAELHNNGSLIQVGDVSMLSAIAEAIETLDKYISPGIGYARSIEGLKDYLEKHPEILQSK